MSEFKVKFRGVRGSFPVADRNFFKVWRQYFLC